MLNEHQQQLEQQELNLHKTASASARAASQPVSSSVMSAAVTSGASNEVSRFCHGNCQASHAEIFNQPVMLL